MTIALVVMILLQILLSVLLLNRGKTLSVGNVISRIEVSGRVLNKSIFLLTIVLAFYIALSTDSFVVIGLLFAAWPITKLLDTMGAPQ